MSSDAVSGETAASGRVLAVILGRAGSRGLPGKNARLLAGRPVVSYTIDHALAAECVDRVIVSTDGEAIALAARDMGVEVITRPMELANDTATVDDAARHAVTASGDAAEVIVILYANVPVRPEGLIDRAVSLLRDTGADSVQSYADVGKYHPYWMVRLDEAGRVSPHVENTIYRRQDLPPLFIPDGGVIAVTRGSLMQKVVGQPHAFLGADRRGIQHAAGAVVDIDSVQDFAVAESMLASRVAS